MTESSDLKKSIDALEKEVTCVICQDSFQEPKLLPCSHYYCKECIVGLCLQEDDGDPIKCPECRTEHAISQDTIDNLETASKVNRLVDMHRSLFEAYNKERAKLPKESEAPSICAEHDDYMVLYCHSCQSFICRDCAITKHKDHEYEYNSSAGVKRKEELLQSKTFFAEVKKDFESALEEVKKVLTAIQIQGPRMANFLASYFHQLHDILIEQEAALQEKNKELMATKLGKLREQEKKLSIGCDRLSEVIKRIDQHLPGSNCDIIMSSNLMKLIKDRKQSFKKYPKLRLFSQEEKYASYDLKPAVSHFSEVEVQLQSKFLSNAKQLVKIIPWEVVNYKKSINIRKFQKVVNVNQKCSFYLLSENEGSFEGSISTSSPEHHKVRKCDINRIGSFTYIMEYISPITPGEYRINILHHGEGVNGYHLLLTVKEPE